MSDADAVERTIVSKGDYARLKGRTPQALSGWIKEGKLRGAALIGEGRAAKIWVEEADRQLGDLLDVGQQVGQAKAPIGGGASDEATRLARARAESAELELQRNQAKFKAEQGLYMLTDDARAAWAAEQASQVREIELWLGQDLAAELTGAFGAPMAEVKAVLRRAFREFRGRISADHRLAAETLPETSEMADAS